MENHEMNPFKGGDDSSSGRLSKDPAVNVSGTYTPPARQDAALCEQPSVKVFLVFLSCMHDTDHRY